MSKTMTQVISMPMRETMKELAETAAKLNNATDELNEVIADFENSLEDAGVGVSEWLTSLFEVSATKKQYHPKDRDEEYPFETWIGWQLGYAKIDGKWRVAARQMRVERDVSAGPMDDDRESIERDAVALDKAPRLVRVAAAPLLEELALALNKKMRSYLGGVAQAKAQAKHGVPSDEEIIRTLRDGGTKPVFDVTHLAAFVKTDVRTAAKIIERLAKARLLVNVQDDAHWALSDSAEKL
jgi:hypothetical protein